MSAENDPTLSSFDLLTRQFIEVIEERAPVGAFLRCCREHAADVLPWIETRLADHFRERWASTKPDRRPVMVEYTLMFPNHPSDVERVYVSVRQEVEKSCPRLSAFELIGPGEPGGFATVYRARHIALGQDRALKIYHAEAPPQADLDGLLIADAVYAAIFSSDPGFVGTHDAFLTNTGRVVVHMDWVSAPTLAEVIKLTGGPLELRRVCRIMVSLLDALGKVHAEDVAHNDLKPGNVFLSTGDTAQISDFGAATRFEESGSQRTRAYAAPERLVENTDTIPSNIETDIYSVAVIAYELVTGRRRHPDGHRRNEQTAALTGIPPALASAITRGMAEGPEQRFHAAADFAKPFREYLRRWERRKRLAIGGLVAVLCLLAAGWGWNVAQNRKAAIKIEAERIKNEIQEAEIDISQGHFASATEKLDRADHRISGPIPADLRRHLTRVRANLTLVRELDAVRERATTRLPEADGKGGFDTRSAPTGYRAAFTAYGLDVVGGNPKDVSDRLLATAATVTLLAFLDHWVVYEPDAYTRDRLLAVLRQADQGPWLDRFRDPVLRADKAEVERMAASAPEGLAGGTVVALAELMRQHKLDPVPLLRRGLKAHPADFHIAFALSCLTPSTESHRHLDVAQFARPHSVAVHVNRAVMHHKRGDVILAIAALELARQLDPNNPIVHLHLGFCHQLRGRDEDLDRARTAFLEAARIAPNDVRAYTGVASALVLRPDRRLEAINAAKKAIEIDPTYADAHYTLARIQHYSSNERAVRSAAIKGYEATLKLDPDHGGALCELGLLLSADEGELKRAVELLRKGTPIVESSPLKWRIHPRPWLVECERRLAEKRPKLP